jgi:hypothetical protein
MNGICTSILVALIVAVGNSAEIRLESQTRESTARVRVVDTDGRVVPFAALQLMIPGVSTAASITGADGVGHVTGPRVAGVLTIGADGFVRGRIAWPSPTDQEVTVRLMPAASLRVSLVDRRSGSPLTGSAAVLLSTPGSRGTYSESLPNGTGEFLNLPPGPATLIAKAERFAPAVVAIGLRAGETEVQTIELAEAAAVEGFVLDEAGRPISGAVMTVDYGSAGNAQRLLAQLVGGHTLVRGVTALSA